MATRKVKYMGPFDEVEVPELGLVVQRNHQVEVPNDVAARLLENPDWRTVGRGAVSEGDEDDG